MKILLKITLLICWLALANVCTSCSNGLQGTYKGGDNAFFDQLNFTSSKTVEIVFMGATKEAEYKVKDHKIYISTAGETQIFTINDNCLDGGGMLGTYCKN